MPFGLHPKVAWPLVVNALVTILAAVVAAWQKGGQAAALTALVGGGVAILGLVTGYSVSSPPPPITVLNATGSTAAGSLAGTVTTVPTSSGGSVTTVSGP
jgi:hypothetical protein